MLKWRKFQNFIGMPVSKCFLIEISIFYKVSRFYYGIVSVSINSVQWKWIIARSDLKFSIFAGQLISTFWITPFFHKVIWVCWDQFILICSDAFDTICWFTALLCSKGVFYLRFCSLPRTKNMFSSFIRSWWLTEQS